MNIDFESLSQIPQLLKVVTEMKVILEAGTVKQKWLNTAEAAQYTKHKKDTFVKKVKDGHLIRNYHCFKRDGILLFDVDKLDEWVMSGSLANNVSFNNQVTTEIVNSIVI